MSDTSLKTIINGLHGAIVHRYGNGVRASLRRLDPEAPGMAFWKIAVQYLDPYDHLGDGPDPERVRRWALIVWILAEVGQLHKPGRRLGKALAAAKIAEIRVERLLRTPASRLGPEIRPLIRQIRSAGKSVDTLDLAYLILTKDKNTLEQIRNRIARDYYANTQEG